MLDIGGANVNMVGIVTRLDDELTAHNSWNLFGMPVCFRASSSRGTCLGWLCASGPLPVGEPVWDGCVLQGLFQSGNLFGMPACFRASSSRGTCLGCLCASGPLPVGEPVWDACVLQGLFQSGTCLGCLCASGPLPVGEPVWDACVLQGLFHSGNLFGMPVCCRASSSRGTCLGCLCALGPLPDGERGAADFLQQWQDSTDRPVSHWSAGGGRRRTRRAAVSAR